MMVGAALFFFSVFGLLIALYFALVSYGLMKPDQRFIPSICRMDERTCLSLLGTAEARIFGLPNSIPGLLYYAFMTGAAILLLLGHSIPLRPIVLVISIATLLFSAYLAYVLLFRLKARCVLCFTSHVVNTLIFVLLLLPSKPS